MQRSLNVDKEKDKKSKLCVCVLIDFYMLGRVQIELGKYNCIRRAYYKIALVPGQYIIRQIGVYSISWLINLKYLFFSNFHPTLEDKCID
jgi:hypothetical protein